MTPWASTLGAWYERLHAPPPPATPRRIAIALSLGSSIRTSVAIALERCGHKCVELGDAPELIIATWWKDTMGNLGLPKGVPVVHWWAGSDTHHTTAHSTERRYNWVVSPWLARVLKQRVGVTARVLAHAPALTPRLLPQSPTRRVLVYCPHRNQGHLKYCWDEIVEVARLCPSVEFAVLLKHGGAPLPNISILPRVDYKKMPAVYARARLLLRLTPSDGLSLSVMEALGFGRHAIWNWWAPGSTHVSNIMEAAEAVQRLIDEPPYAGGVVSALEHRAQADHAMSAAIDEVLS